MNTPVPPGQCQICGDPTEDASSFCLLHISQHHEEVARIRELREVGKALGLEDGDYNQKPAEAAQRARSRFGLPEAKAPLAKREPEKPAPLVPLSSVELENFQTDELQTWWLPKPARDWCEAISAANKAPKSLAVASCLCAMASVLQGRVRVRWKAGVEEPLSLYWFVFSGTGTRKTTIQLRAMRAILQYQQELAGQCAKDAKLVENKRRRLEAQLGRLRRQRQGSKHTEGHQEWLSQIKELERDLDDLVTPLSAEWSQGDVNPSLLPKLLQHNYDAEGIARLSVMVSEGAFLHNLMGRHQGSPILEVALGAINGEPLQFVRASKVGDEPVKVRLPHTFMTMCQLLQPHLLDLLKSSEMSDTGFAGRCIIEVLSSEPIKPGWEAPPIPDAIQAAYDAWLRALIEEELPDVVDLTLEPATARAVRAMYEAIETDGSGWSQRATGIISRLVALVDIGNLVAKRMADGNTKPKHAPVRGRIDIPKGIHIVTDTDYDWLDETGDSSYGHLRSAGTCGDDLQHSETIDRTGMQHGTGTLGTGHGAENAGAPGIIEYLFQLIHIQRLRLVRSLDRPAVTVASLAERVLLHLRAASPQNRPQAEEWNVRAALKGITPGKRPSTDQFYAALEELEQAGAIEWIPDSMRKKGRDARYRRFKLLVRASHLESVKKE